MAKSDLQARPVYHHLRDSIEAHLTIVFAALAVSRRIEQQTGWSIRKFIKTARRHRAIQIQAGPHTITAADPIDDIRQAIDHIHGRAGAHSYEAACEASASLQAIAVTATPAGLLRAVIAL